MKKQVLAILMAAATGVAAFGACTRRPVDGEDGEDYSGKTVLNIGNYDGGIGHDWLDATAARFEEAYKDWVNPEDPEKVGVKVKVTNKKSPFQTTALNNNIPYDNLDIYFTNIAYDAGVKAGVFYNITDWIEEKIFDTDGELASLTGNTAVRSVLDTMDARWQPNYNVSKQEGKNEYYAIPYYYSVGGAWFDGDLFDSKGLYFGEDGQLGLSWAQHRHLLSKGPDGVKGTYDDGQPATMEQFVELLDYMITVGVTPFTWSAANLYQRTSVLTAMLVNYLGKETAQKLWTENDISPIIGSDGMKAAIALAELLGKNGTKYVSEKAFTSNSHTGAQEEFIYSKESSSPIGIFLEFSWWESEIRQGFNDMGSYSEADGYGKRNFRLMCMPNFSAADETKYGVPAKTMERQTIFAENSYNAVVVSSYTKQPLLTKMFLQFNQQRSELVSYAAHSSCFRPFEYLENITEEEYSTCTKMVQNVLDLMKQDTTDVVIAELWSDKLKNSFDLLRNLPFHALMPTEVKEPITYFYNNPSKTAAEYIAGISAFYAQRY